MKLSRRAVMAGAASLPLISSPVFAQGAEAQRRFEIYRGSTKIGEQVVAIAQSASGLKVDIDIDIKVKLFGFDAYSYSMMNRETWVDGEVASIHSRTQENGDSFRVDAERAPDGLDVEASKFTGLVTGSIATTTYWHPVFLERPVWISTQDGSQFDVNARRDATTTFETPLGAFDATRYAVVGDIDLNLYYDPSGEWVGSTFEARGQTARIVTQDPDVSLTRLWDTA